MVDSPALLLGGLLVGFALGFLFHKGRVANYAVIVGQFLFQDFTVLKVMLTAIVVGGIGIYGMLGLGLIDGLMVKPATMLGVTLGGLIFGVGMTLLGYCPGTCVAAVASGSRHGLVGLLGGVVGAALYVEAFPWVDERILSVADMGKVTLAELWGVPPGVLLFLLAVISLSLFALIHRWERRQTSVEPS